MLLLLHNISYTVRSTFLSGYCTTLLYLSPCTFLQFFFMLDGKICWELNFFSIQFPFTLSLFLFLLLWMKAKVNAVKFLFSLLAHIYMDEDECECSEVFVLILLAHMDEDECECRVKVF